MTIPHLTLEDAGLRLLVGAVLGVGIGFERQWRQRMAGLHTCALVATGATLYTIITPSIQNGQDQTRVVAQIVSGMGFLGGGVILREGLSARGLNTAVTMWATAAVGALAGFGLYAQALFGAVAISGLNWLLTPLVEMIDRGSTAVLRRIATYEIRVKCQASAESEVRRLLIDALNKSKVALNALRSATSELGTVEIFAELMEIPRDDKLIEQLVNRIRIAPGVIETTWSAREPR